MEIVLYVMVIPLLNVAVERHPRYIFAVKDTHVPNVQYLVDQSLGTRVLRKMQTNFYLLFFRK